MNQKTWMMLVLAVFAILGILCNGCASAKYKVSCVGGVVKGHCMHHEFVDRDSGLVYRD